jgi:hypothetical protein
LEENTGIRRSGPRGHQPMTRFSRTLLDHGATLMSRKCSDPRNSQDDVTPKWRVKRVFKDGPNTA